MDDLTSAPGPEDLRRFTPFQDLDEGQLILLAGRIEVIRADEGERIFSIGDAPDGQYFLLQGVIELESGDGMRRAIEGGTDKSCDAITPERPCTHHATALDASTLLRIDPSLIGALHGADPEYADGSGEIHPLVREIRQDLQGNRFSLPSLPEVALRIKKAIESESASSAKITKIVSADPVITAKLIRAANSAFYHGSDPIETAHAAIVRLGMNTTKQLVISFALRDLFRLKEPTLKKRMHQSWRHSTEIGAICMVLAQLTGRLEPEQALLAGLVHDIGVVSILSHASTHSELARDEKALMALIRALRAEVGGMILRHWKFSDAITRAAIHARDWGYDSGTEIEYCDLVIIAQLHSLMKAGRVSEHPPFDRIPAYRKLSPDILTPQGSLKILDQAKDQLGEVLQLLA